MIKPAQKNIAEKMKVSYCVMQLPKKQYQQMGNYVDSKRLRPCMTSACEETRKLFKAGAALYFCNSVL